MSARHQHFKDIFLQKKEQALQLEQHHDQVPSRTIFAIPGACLSCKWSNGESSIFHKGAWENEIERAPLVPQDSERQHLAQEINSNMPTSFGAGASNQMVARRLLRATGVEFVPTPLRSKYSSRRSHARAGSNVEQRERITALQGGSGSDDGGQGNCIHSDEHSLVPPEAQNTKNNTEQRGLKRHELPSIGANYETIEQNMQQLEISTNANVDDRAFRSLWALPANNAEEALRRVEDVVRQQSGHCHNLSSLLQLECRKLKTWHNKLNDAVTLEALQVGTRTARVKLMLSFAQKA